MWYLISLIAHPLIKMLAAELILFGKKHCKFHFPLAVIFIICKISEKFYFLLHHCRSLFDL